MKPANGFTLTELMVAAALVSVVFLASTAMYVAAARSFRGMDAKTEEIGAFAALEHIVRRASLGNRAVISAGGSQLKVRWDYADAGAPLRTPGDFTDDRYVKYGVVGQRLRTRIDAAEAGDVTAADPEVEPGLRVVSARPFSAPDARSVAIELTAQSGEPPREKTVRTQVSLGARAL